MKKKSQPSNAAARPITEDEIRDYAYHLYQQSGCVAGRDVENWFEAKACLEAVLTADFAGDRHAGRVAKLSTIPQDA